MRTEHHFTVMGGPATLIINHADKDEDDITHLINSVEATLVRLEARYSRYKPDSLVSLINRRAGSGEVTEIDEETRALFEVGNVLWARSGGLFDPTAGVLRHAWNFAAGQPTTPSTGPQPNPATVNTLLDRVGWQFVRISNEGVQLLRTGMEIDLGGLVKEYAADAAATQIRAAGIESALIELAGDIVAVGPDQGDKPWRIGIRDPRSKSPERLSVELIDAAIATSGSYERFIELNGKRFSHLLNPRTGWPVSGPASVSVIGPNCLTAGAVATVACLHDTNAAQAWLRDANLPWRLIDGDQVFGDLGILPPNIAKVAVDRTRYGFYRPIT